MIDPFFAMQLIILVFVVGYLAIIFEYNVRINKTASALLMAVLTWLFVFIASGQDIGHDVTVLGEHVNNVSQIIYFLLGAMTLVELIDCHKGFKVITDIIQTSSKRKMLWIIGFVTFFLSAILDNLTTTIVMVSLLRKLVPDRDDRLMLGATIVIAANAGGAWTPIGDVTTTMLWINGNLSTVETMKYLFAPSMATLLVALSCLSFSIKGKFPKNLKKESEVAEPGAKLIFYAGIGALVFVPIFKAMTGLPPFMGMLISLGMLWLITDLLHHPYKGREHLRVPQILTRIDISGVLFFLGILLCIGALESIGILSGLANFLDVHVHNLPLIATIIGLVSAVIDNVPLVAATMGMYDLATYPMDDSLWQLIAFCAGTGGSILIIGSAAGVALMGLEKIDFLWYFKKVSWVALLSYFAGNIVYMIQSQLVGSL
jgi:NhaD family Na+/H+ antiporter